MKEKCCKNETQLSRRQKHEWKEKANNHDLTQQHYYGDDHIYIYVMVTFGRSVAYKCCAAKKKKKNTKTKKRAIYYQ